LTEQLLKMSDDVIPAVKPSQTHALPCVMIPLAAKLIEEKLLYNLSQSIAERFFGPISMNIHNLKYRLLQQYGVAYLPHSLPTLIDVGFHPGLIRRSCRKVFIVGGDFIILPRYVARLARFDETFINGAEDHDIGMRFFSADKIRFLNYAVGSIGGATLSPTRRSRNINALRSVLNFTYLFYKWKNNFQGSVDSVR
jgi:hypothetical protein